MIKSKLCQAISWPLAGVLSHFCKFLKFSYSCLLFIIIYAIIMGQLKPTQRRYYVIKRHH